VLPDEFLANEGVSGHHRISAAEIPASGESGHAAMLAPNFRLGNQPEVAPLRY